MRLLFILVLGCCLAPFSNPIEAFSIEDVTSFHDQIIHETKEKLQDALFFPKITSEPFTDLCLKPEREASRVSSTPIAPMSGYAPVVIVNNTGIDASRLYFLGTGKSINGKAHFLKPNRLTGICSYAYPNKSNSIDRNISVRLSSLPTDGNGAYYLYLPQQNSGRCYISVDRPLYVVTTVDSIRSPNITSANDPNYYTLYQDFELTLDGNYDLHANVYDGNYFSLPMGLGSFTYPTGNPYPTLDDVIVSGFSIKSSRQAVLTSIKEREWQGLIIPFYKDPYIDSLPLTDLRMLSTEQSLGMGRAMHVSIQSNGISNPASPYFELTLSPIDTEIPNPTLEYGPYTLKVNSLSHSAKPISIIYSTTAGSGPNIVQPVPQSGMPITLNNVCNQFWIKFDSSEGCSFTYVVYPKHQFIIPKAARYNVEDERLMSNISFLEESGENLEFTLSLPSL